MNPPATSSGETCVSGSRGGASFAKIRNAADACSKFATGWAEFCARVSGNVGGLIMGEHRRHQARQQQRIAPLRWNVEVDSGHSLFPWSQLSHANREDVSPGVALRGTGSSPCCEQIEFLRIDLWREQEEQIPLRRVHRPARAAHHAGHSAIRPLARRNAAG